MTRRPSVTIVVPTLHRPASLTRALRSLLAQETGAAFTYEILVVDNSPEPEAQTARVVRAAATSRFVPVRSVHEPRAGVAHARNRGVTASGTDWIAFCDDDQIADPDWLRHLLSAARSLKAACVGGAIALQLPAKTGTLGPYCRRLLGEQPFVGAPHPCDGIELPSSGNMLIARDAMVACGAFDAAMTAGGEDAEWVGRLLQLGRRVVVAPGALVYHVVPAHRTRAAYVRWVAERAGSQRAYTDWKHRGTRWLLAMGAARIVHAAARLVPALALAWVRRADASRLDAVLRLRRAHGYVVEAWDLLRRHRPGAVLFRGDLNMRHESAVRGSEAA